MHVSQDILDSRYRLLERIGSGGMGVIYRARDLMTGQEVALKRVTMSSERLTFATKASNPNFHLALAQEFRLLSSLRHPHIISVLDYGFDAERMPYYTMDLLQEPQTIVRYTEDFLQNNKISLIMQMAQALAYLHRRGIIHRDLKPENVLVVEDNVRVLDFGLAVQTGNVTEHSAGLLSGTLGYMAPEVLMGLPPSEQSDLYALGVIAYEMFYGTHPFDLNDLSRLIQDVIYKDVDFDGSVESDIQEILQRLLSKRPEDRYFEANDVIAAFASVPGAPKPQESAMIRDSYIQAANFVGRAREMQQLETALQQIARPDSRQGSVWLIGGESGVGKSRMLEEIRTLALVEGALVLRGQAIDSGVPYQVWRNAVRRLILSTEMEDFELSVLREIAPDVEELVGREIPPVPDIGERAGVQRLAAAVTALFQDQNRPVVLLLEDLHWAYEGLDILEYMLQNIDGLQLLIVGTYRNEEMPELPRRLPKARVVTLDRLSDAEIQDLSVSILGERIGRQQNILNLLQRETEGNVFFLVEVVRVLAEEAGKLSNIGAVTLPDHVFSGSMRTVIERRLSRLPIDALPMLRLAAVYGRDLDLTVLRQIDAFMNFEKWLLMCSNAAILEALGETWRFAHDRMRDGILDVLDPAERPKLNYLVAEAIEKAYPNDKVYALRLMRHWAAAGEPEKEAHYARIAAIQAFDVSDYREALALFSRAAASTGVDTPAEVFVYQGEIHYRLGNYKAAQASLNMALRREPTNDERTHVLSILGDIASEQGEYPKAEQILVEALQLSRQDVTQTSQARVLSSLGEIYWRMGQISDATNHLYEADEIARDINDVDRQLAVLNRIAIMALYRGDIDDAEEVLEEAYFTSLAANHSERAMIIIDSLGTVARNQKNYTKAETRYLSAIEFAHSLRLQQQLPPYMANLAVVRALQGQVRSARADLREALGRAVSSARPPQELMAVAGFALLEHLEGTDARALMLSGAVLCHPACDYALRIDVRNRLAQWNMAADDAIRAGCQENFDLVVGQLMID